MRREAPSVLALSHPGRRTPRPARRKIGVISEPFAWASRASLLWVCAEWGALMMSQARLAPPRTNPAYPRPWGSSPVPSPRVSPTVRATPAPARVRIPMPASARPERPA